MATIAPEVLPPADEPRATRTSHRLAAIDVVRGVVMILMAIDHVRVYSGVPAGGPTAGVFFTRWVTHFVAPAFVFLAGTGAFLHGKRMGERRELARFLLTRGAWLVLLELTLIRVMWTFNLDFGTYLLAGVIWVIGICMMLMAALVYLPTAAIGTIGVAIIVGHNLLDFLSPAAVSSLQESAFVWFWQILYFGGGIQLGADGPQFIVLYSVVPWIGVMAAGYVFGAVMTQSAERRRSISILLGLGAITLFILMRFADVYGDPRSWHAPGGAPVLLRFLNTSKYPASLLFLLMTLGPAILAVGLLDRVRGRVADTLATFGRVPLFYYLLHIPAIHIAALIVSWLRTGRVEPWLFANHPMMVPPVPEGYTWSLPLLYLTTAIVVALLYIPCRRFARLKEKKRDSRWLSYL
jgi:uncharacterized membrane protein